jgi:hypothetical protein
MDGEGDNAFWTKIGAVFEHKDSKGSTFCSPRCQ